MALLPANAFLQNSLASRPFDSAPETAPLGGRGAFSEGEPELGRTQPSWEELSEGVWTVGELTPQAGFGAAGARPPPSEEPEPQDARGRAAALRAQFRRRFGSGCPALSLRVSGSGGTARLPPAGRPWSPRSAVPSRSRRGADPRFVPRP